MLRDDVVDVALDAPAALDAVVKAKAVGQYLPMYAIAGNRDMYKPRPVNQTPRSLYNVIRMWAFLSRFRRNVTTGALQVDSTR